MKNGKTFTRPAGWKRQLQHSYFDDSKRFDGKKYDDVEKEDAKNKEGKFNNSIFGKIKNYLKKK